MSNKGALAVTNLLDSVKGISKLITNKKVIDENEHGYGGLQFDLKTKGKSFRHKIFLNFNDLYDLTIRGKTNTNILVGELTQLLTWVVELDNNLEEE